MDIAELKQKSVAELHELAEKLNITNYSGLRKQDLIFRIEQSLLETDTVIRGEGVLEILPEGYGFLRSQDWNYLYGPDDIYVSPSQIKRFDLRTGDTVMGQVRPPKEAERYFALLRVEAINYQDPNVLSEKVFFDDLTPLHPDSRTVFMRAPGGTEFSFKNDHSSVTTGPYNADKWISPAPDPGDTVFFPSYLMHAVPSNPGERRITLAFNAIPASLDSWGYKISFSG